MRILCGDTKCVVITLRDFRMIPSTYSNYGPNINLRSILGEIVRKRLVNHVCVLSNRTHHKCIFNQTRIFFL